MEEDIDFVFGDILSDDEDNLNIIERPRRPKIIRERVNHMELWENQDFKKRFRLSKHTVEVLLVQINDQLIFPTQQNSALSPLVQLLIALRFYATGSTEQVVGDFAGVSEATVCRVLKRVSIAIAALSNEYIHLPENIVKLEETKQSFKNIAQFPNVIGAIDCTHIRIQSSGGNIAEQFRNRKGYFSINVQTVANADLKFMNIVARWPGSVHDRTIFDNSILKGHLEAGRYPNCFLLGDSGYTLTKYMMTPLADTNTRLKALYNESQIRTRNVVERKYGIWKRRFPVLRSEIKLKLDTALTVIVATAVLHNLAIEENEGEPEAEDGGERQEEDVQHNRAFEREDGITIRNNLIRNNLINENSFSNFFFKRSISICFFSTSRT